MSNRWIWIRASFFCFIVLLFFCSPMFLAAQCSPTILMSGGSCPAWATATPASGVAPLTVTFDAAPPLTEAQSFPWSLDHWDFGDGQTSTVWQTTHIYQVAGSYTATATFYQMSAGEIFGTSQPSVVVTVTTPPSLTAIAVSPQHPSIFAGTQQQFTATGTYSNGSTQDLTSTVIWSSSSASVATINSAGLVTTVAQGTSTITATAGSVNGFTMLTVTAPPTLASIAISPQNPSVSGGAQQQFRATGTYTDGSTQNLTSTATWSSSRTYIATINSAGLVIAVEA